MRRQWPSLALPAAGVLALLSLFLPWQQASDSAPFDPGGRRENILGLLQPPDPQHIDGWSAVGELLALSALLVVVLGVLALLRPGLRDRLPLGQAALALGFFGAAVFAQTYSFATNPHAQGIDASFGLAYGAVIGTGAALLALAAAAALRRDELGAVRAAHMWPGLIGTLALLVAMLLPWTRSDTGDAAAAIHVDTLGVALAPGAIAAVLAVRLLAARTLKVELAVVLLVFVLGAFVVDFPLDRRYGAWVGLVSAGWLLATALAERRPLPLRSLATLPAAALVVLAASLFAPWQHACYPPGELAQLGTSARCVTTNGWSDASSLALAAGLLAAVALTGIVLALVAETPSRVELAVAIVLLVATAGLRLETDTLAEVDFGIGYGAIAGFVAATALVVVALVGIRSAAHGASGAAAAGAVLAAVFAVAVVVPWWNVVSPDIWSPFASGLTRLTWLSLAAALVAIRLAGRWIARSGGGRLAADELVVLPLVLEAIVLLDAFRFGRDDLGWNTAILGTLAAALAGLGLVERRGGLARIQIPDLLRLDRI